MKANILTNIYDFKRYVFVVLVLTSVSFLPTSAQIKYLPSDERREASMGEERVARFATATYESKPAQKDDEIRWVQIDLGQRKKIDGIKLLPKLILYGYVRSEGFPSRFKIEMSDDPTFTASILYENQTREDFKDPYDLVCTFAGKEVMARYVRLTATRLRQQKLALSKL